jgi:glutamine amidotransferase
LEECGARAVITDNPADIARADRCVLPGVGAFTLAMNRICKSGLNDAIFEFVRELQRPLLGICLGMQLIGDHGEEGQGARGLGLLPARAVRLQPKDATERIPHIGWNELVLPEVGTGLFAEIPSGTDFYFVHSYHMVCDRPEDVLATTPYCGEFVSAVGRDNLLGVQFHPEKSQRAGIRLLQNFLSI